MAASKKKAKRVKYLAKLQERRAKARKLEALLLGEELPAEYVPEPFYHAPRLTLAASEDAGRTGLVKRGKPKWERK